MRNKFTLAASITAAALALAACKTDNETTQATSHAKSGSHLQILDAVETVSITRAYDDVTLAQELQDAQDITGDSLNNDGFLSLVFNITTENNGQLMVHTVAYCNEFIGQRNYNENCAASIALNLAAINSVYDGRIANHVATDNAAIRNSANTSLRWLRTAMGLGLKHTNFQVVRTIEAIEALPPQPAANEGNAFQP